MVAVFNHFEEIGEKLHLACVQVVKKVAFDCQANIQAQIRANGQIDTGFMMNSVYVVTSDSSTYTGGGHALPEIERAENDTTAYVAVAASYGIYQNYGTRYQPPRPFFEPGIDATRPGFEAALSKIEEMLR